LQNAEAFNADWRPLVKKLYSLMGADGFDAGKAQSLSELRAKVKQGEKQLIGHKKVTEDYGILNAVGAWSKDGGGIDNKQKMRAAALKLLRHVYLVNKSGNRKAW